MVVSHTQPVPSGSYLARRASAATSPPSMGTPGAAATSWRPWLTLVSRLGRASRSRLRLGFLLGGEASCLGYSGIIKIN